MTGLRKSFHPGGAASGPRAPGPPVAAYSGAAAVAQARPATLSARPGPPMAAWRGTGRTGAVQAMMAAGLANLLTLTASKNGKPSEFRAWLAAVEGELTAGTVTVETFPVVELNGYSGLTVEVPCVLRYAAGGRIPGTGFVIHYHPQASKAKVGSPYASQMHIKAKRSGQFHEDVPPQIAANVPKFKDIKGLYK